MNKDRVKDFMAGIQHEENQADKPKPAVLKKSEEVEPKEAKHGLSDLHSLMNKGK